MNCKTYRTEIDDAHGGGHLSAGTEAHLRLCEGCRTFFRERQALRRLVGELEPVAAPPDFEFRLRARLAATADSPNRRARWTSFAPGAVSIALAACFALTVAAALRFKYPGLRNDVAVETPDAATRPATNAGVDAARTESARMSVESVASGSNVSESSLNVADVAMPDGADELVAEMRTASASRRRGMSARENNFASYSRGAERRLESTSFNVRPAAVNRVGGMESESGRDGNELPFAVPVRTPGESMKIVLRDERGTSRVVAIDPVSFGAQEFVRRKNVATRASLQPSEGVW